MSIHPELAQAIKDHNYKVIARFMCSSGFSSDSEYTLQRVISAFIDGWKECERITKELGVQNGK